MENNIHIDKNLPLLICDADEVILTLWTHLTNILIRMVCIFHIQHLN